MKRRKLQAIEVKLERARIVRAASDEDKATRVLRESETVSRLEMHSPGHSRASSPTSSSLSLAGRPATLPERCAPHLGRRTTTPNLAFRPGSQGSLRPDSRGGGEPRPASQRNLRLSPRTSCSWYSNAGY